MIFAYVGAIGNLTEQAGFYADDDNLVSVYKKLMPDSSVKKGYHQKKKKKSFHF